MKLKVDNNLIPKLILEMLLIEQDLRKEEWHAGHSKIPEFCRNKTGKSI